MSGKIPSVIQLPKGVRLTGVLFRVTELDADGRPRMFELLSPDAPATGKGLWTLFADERAIRMVVPEEHR